MMQGPYSVEALREAWSESDDSMINAHLRSHSHTNFTQQV